MKEKSKNINVDAAYLHALSDMLLTIGVLIAAIIIYIWPVKKYKWSKYADPFCTFIFSVIVCITCKPILSNCIYILREGAPDLIDTNEMKKEIIALDGVTAVHDFHVWSLSRGKYSLSAHVECDADPMKILKQATKIISNYGIDHSTLQVEDKYACE